MYLICTNKFSGGGGELAARNMCKILSKHKPTYYFTWLDLCLYECSNDKFEKKSLFSLLYIFYKANAIYSHLYISNIITLFIAFFAKRQIVVFNQGSIKNITFLPSLQKFLVRLTYPRAKKIYCITESVKDDLTAIGIDQNTISLINNPIYMITSPDVRRDQNAYIYVGRIEKIKNLDKILRAFEETNTTLRVYGRGSLSSYLQDKFKDTWHRAYQGHTDNAVMEIARSKSLIMMSQREGIPMVALEAICVSTPLIIPSNLTSMHFLLDEVIEKHPTFNIHKNGIIMHENSSDNLIQVLNYLEKNSLKVLNKNVLQPFTVKKFEEEVLLL